MKETDKTDLVNFTPTSQFACTKCVTFKSILDAENLTNGDHLCFEYKQKFYHAILSSFTVSKSFVQMHVICKLIDLKSLHKMCGHSFQPTDELSDDVIVHDILPEMDVTSINVYVFQYGRTTYSKSKIVQRALAHVLYSHGEHVAFGSLTNQRIRPEARFRNETPKSTSAHFATWCSTGESFTFEGKKEIEYERKSGEISMRLKLYRDQNIVQQLTKVHRQRLLCDSCFLSELVTIVNESKNPDKNYKLVSENSTAWINSRKIPRGLYRVKYKIIDNQVIIKLKRYNSKYKHLALIINTETFTFTLDNGQQCSSDVEIKYKFPYPFWKIPDSNTDRF